VLVKEIKSRLQEIPIELCEWLDIDILEGAIGSDHVHMYLSVPPKHPPSHVMKVLKGKSAEYLRRDFPDLSKRYWGLHIWARGYFVSTVGIDRNVIKKYVKEQEGYQIRQDQLFWQKSPIQKASESKATYETRYGDSSNRYRWSH